MSDFDQAIPVVLAHEGGYVNDADDPGGETNFGITLKWLQSVRPEATSDDVKNLTVDQATALYRDYWWNTQLYGSLRDQTVATKVFDAAINMGVSEAHRLFQQAINDCGADLTVDGVFGQGTLQAANSCDSEQLVAAYSQELAHHYGDLATKNPKLQKFLHGWLERSRWPN